MSKKVHAVVARSIFRNQKCTKLTTDGSRALLEVEVSKKCTPLWLEAYFEVKSVKNWRAQSTLGSWDVEKSARRCGAKHLSTSKVQKTDRFRALLEVEMSKKCTRLWREAHFEVKSAKNCGVRSIFGRSDVLLRGRRKGLCTLPKVSKTWGFCSISKNDGRCGTAGAVQETCWSEMLGGQAVDFLRGLHFGASDLQVCWDDFVWQVQHFVWPGITFSWQAQYFRQVDRKNGKMHWYEAVSSALNFPFLKEVSQNCFAFDVVNFKKMRKSRRVASFLTLSSSKNEEVSQNCFVFDVVKFQKLRKSRRIASLSSLRIDR